MQKVVNNDKAYIFLIPEQLIEEYLVSVAFISTNVFFSAQPIKIVSFGLFVILFF